MAKKEKPEFEESVGKTAYEHYSENIWQNKWRGVVWGYITGLIGVLSNIVGVALHNVLFGGHEKFDVQKAFNANMMNNGNVQNGEQNGEQNSEQKGEEKKGQEKEAQEKAEKNKPHEKESKLDGVPEEGVEKATKELLDNPDIQKMFESMGVDPVFGKSEIYMLAKGSEHDTYMTISYADFIDHPSEQMMKVFYNMNQEKLTDMTGEELMKESAMKALNAKVAINYFGSKNDYQTTIAGKPMGELAFGTKNGSIHLMVQTTNVEGVLSVTCNGNEIATIRTEDLDKGNFDIRGLQDGLQKEMNKQPERRSFILKDGYLNISIKDGNVMLNHVQKGTKERVSLGKFDLSDTSCIREMTKALSDANISVDNVKPEAIAYTIAVTSNASMEPERRDGSYVNPFTGDPELDGTPHLNVVHNENGVFIKENIPHEYLMGGGTAKMVKMETKEVNAFLSDKDITSVQLLDLAKSVQAATEDVLVAKEKNVAVPNFDREEVLVLNDMKSVEHGNAIDAAEALNRRDAERLIAGVEFEDEKETEEFDVISPERSDEEER